MSGWIKLHRKLLDNPVFKNHKLLQTFLYCLLKATHSDRDQLIGDSIVKLKAGQLATGRKAISAATGLTEQNVRTALSKLELLSILTINPTTKYSIISISNWDQHQVDNQQVTSCQPTSNQQVTTNKNVNNYKNKDNTSSAIADCPHEEIVELYHSTLPTLRRMKVWNEPRQKLLRKRWRESEKHQNIDFWSKLFNYVSQSDFLTGKINEFEADLEWIIKPSNFIKIIEGKYHEQ